MGEYVSTFGTAGTSVHTEWDEKASTNGISSSIMVLRVALICVSPSRAVTFGTAGTSVHTEWDEKASTNRILVIRAHCTGVLAS